MNKLAAVLVVLLLVIPVALLSAQEVVGESASLPYTPTRLEWAALHAQANWGGEMLGGAYVVDFVQLADKGRIHVEVSFDREAGGRLSAAREVMQAKTQLLLRYLESMGWERSIKLGGDVKK